MTYLEELQLFADFFFIQSFVHQLHTFSFVRQCNLLNEKNSHPNLSIFNVSIVKLSYHQSRLTNQKNFWKDATNLQGENENVALYLNRGSIESPIQRV